MVFRMKIIIYDSKSNRISGTLSAAEKKIIDAEFDKAKPGDDLEIELLDKKGFISEKIINDVIEKLQVDNTGKGDFVIKGSDVEQFKKHLGLK